MQEPLPADSAWIKLLRKIMTEGQNVEPRGKRTLELLSHKCEVDMRWPVNDCSKRNLGYKFMCAEAWWIMTGQNRLNLIEPFSKTIKNFSDDGVFFFGAYGPRIVDQLPHIIKSLRNDRETRQAVLTTWRPSPPDSKDIPCTVAIQFVIREWKLHCIVYMRSSDAWLGVPYDWFNFAMLSGGICLLLASRGLRVELGTLHFNAGSQHLYEENFEVVNDLIRNGCENALYLTMPFDPFKFESYEDLAEHLITTAHGVPVTGYLTREMKDYYERKTE